MQLTLRYHPSAQRPASAAFLRGTDPAAWLRELGGWGVAAGQLRCYLVPESIHSVRPAGLLVVVPGGNVPADVLEPYGAVDEQRLYVPVQATLWPATSPEELHATLLWPVQFWHPRIGLVGFDTTDELDLTSLLDCGAPNPTDWSRARPGPPPRPLLQQIRVLPPTAAEVVETMQAGIGTEPLTKLPGLAPARPGRARQWLKQLRYRVLVAVLALVRVLRGPGGQRFSDAGGFLRTLGKVIGIMGLAVLVILAMAHAGKAGMGTLLVVLVRVLTSIFNRSHEAPNRASRPATPARPGALQRLEKWLGGTITNLEQKRQREIERLLKLFGENPAEALKYAIPLGGPYQNRGTARPSAHLVSRDTSFNLGGLGGGRSTDVWDLGNYQYELRQQYQAAAHQQAQAGRYQQAAYIHAHLLGDYLAAANVLEQGGLYREAAALHRDHLRNPSGAAHCLERGGLLLEAAEIFSNLDLHEQAGDLYAQLAQPATAARHYERGVTLLLGNQDHPAAARLLADKLREPARARQVLLEGWGSSGQAEKCLTQYFGVVAATPENDLGAHVNEVFQQHTAAEQRMPLLRVLAAVVEQHPANPALLAASREVAYEVASTEADAGNLAALPLLRHFQPTDRLLAADCSRYTSSQPRPARPDSRRLRDIQLLVNVEWKSAVGYRQQWVAVGVRDGHLHLARGNWYGNVEYYSWTTAVAPEVRLVLVANEQHSTRIMLRTSEPLALAVKLLPKNKYFAEALTVECPAWLPAWPTRVALLPNGEVATARLLDQAIEVQRYAADGRLLAPFTCRLPATEPAFTGTERPSWPCELIFHQNKYYSYWSEWLVEFSDDAPTRLTSASCGVFQLSRSPYAADFQLVAALEEGLALWQPTSPTGTALQLLGGECTADTDLRLVGPEHLVAVEFHQAILYHLTADGAQPLRTIDAIDHFAAVLPTSNRQQFALLETSGRLLLHELNSEEG